MRAVKLLRNAASPKDKADFTQEAETMLVLSHPNLVRMIGVAVQQKPWLCVLEYMRYGDLKSLLEMCREKGVPLRYREMLCFSYQLARGCAYLSEKRLVHMDLAARNALVGDDNSVKVADFGLTRPMEEGKPYLFLRETMRLALKWVAPESMTKKIFSEASDVWAFGVVLWEIASYGSTPYGRVLTSEIQEKVCNGLRLQQPSTCPTEFYNVMLDCWKELPRDRPSFATLDTRITAMFDEHPGEDRDVGAAVAKGKAVKGAHSTVGEQTTESKVRRKLQTPV
jgi:serine/threonine protein kinase